VNKNNCLCYTCTNKITSQYLISKEQGWDHIVCMGPDIRDRIQRYCITFVFLI
jgi:hypothetical protein